MKQKEVINISLSKEEKKLKEELKSIKSTNNKKAQLLAFSNSLLLSSANIDKEQLYSYLIKSYLTNKNDDNKITDIDFICDNVDYLMKNKNKLNNTLYETSLKSTIESLLEYIQVDENTRYNLALNYIENIDKDNKTNNITYSLIINELNRISNEAKKAKTIKVRTYASNR